MDDSPDVIALLDSSTDDDDDDDEGDGERGQGRDVPAAVAIAACGDEGDGASSRITASAAGGGGCAARRPPASSSHARGVATTPETETAASAAATATVNGNGSDDDVVAFDCDSSSDDDDSDDLEVVSNGRGSQNLWGDRKKAPQPTATTERIGECEDGDRKRSPVPEARQTARGDHDDDGSCSDDDDDDLDDLLGSGPVFGGGGGGASSRRAYSSSFASASSSTSRGNGKRCAVSISTSSSLSASVTCSSSATGTCSTRTTTVATSSSTRRVAAQISSKSTTTAGDEREAKRLKKEEEKRLRASQRESQREEARRAKEVEKKARADDRARRAAEKRRALETEKSAREGRVNRERQEKGKFANKEICAHVEKALSSSPVGAALREELSAKGYTVKDDVEYPVEGCVRWSRRDYLSGGACVEEDGDAEGVEWMDVVAVVFHNPKQFLRLLMREHDAEDPDDYPLLRRWVARVRASQGTTRYGRVTAHKGDGGPRIVLVLHEVQKELNRQWNKGKRRKSFIPTNEEELHDATIWMLMEERIECEFTSSEEETVEFMRNLTRALSEFPYAEEATELHCIKKIKSDKDAVESLDRARDCWRRQLQQIPRVSQGMALQLVGHYPTARSLVERYMDPDLTVEQKRTLLASCFSAGKTKQVKLSDCIYRFMTSDNPLELI